MSDITYTMLSGAIAAEQAIETISHNIANIATPGFKAQHLAFEQHLTSELSHEQFQTQVRVSQGYADMSEGTLKMTGAPLDVALRGPGFFVVQTADGERLTRQGNFTHSTDGSLKTQSGHVVMGQNGPIFARADLPLNIDRYGRVLSDGLYVDTLARQGVNKQTDLIREDDSLWRLVDERAALDINTQLEVGALEQSNVKSVHEMSNLVKITREFEQTLRMLEAKRMLQQKAASQLG